MGTAYARPPPRGEDKVVEIAKGEVLWLLRCCALVEGLAAVCPALGRLWVPEVLRRLLWVLFEVHACQRALLEGVVDVVALLTPD